MLRPLTGFILSSGDDDNDHPYDEFGELHKANTLETLSW